MIENTKIQTSILNFTLSEKFKLLLKEIYKFIIVIGGVVFKKKLLNW